MRRIRFFDDDLVVARVNVERRVHPPRKHRCNPVMQAQAPWEDKGFSFSWPTVLYDDEDGLFKAWYETINSDGAFGCYAESDDGVRWRRPELGLVSWQGSRKNNIFYRGTYRAGTAVPICPCVTKRGPGDWHLYYWDALKARGPAGVIHYTSRDGIRWQRGKRNPVMQTPVDRTRSGGVEDVLRVSYDPVGDQFLMSMRTLPLENLDKPLLQKKVPSGLTQRRVSLATSRDGARFTKMRTVLAPELNDPWDVQFYGMSPFRFEDIFLGHLLCYRTGTPNMDVELASSRDGETWRRVAPNVRYIPNGRKGSCDCGIIHCSSAPVPVGSKLYIYHLGHNSDHRGGTVDGRPRRGTLCLAVADAGRMVSVRAGERGGGVLLGPVTVAGNRLTLDADARRGEVRIALRDPQTYAELPGFAVESCEPLRADARAHAARWRGRKIVASLRGKKVLIHATLTDADLFSVGFERG